MLQVGIDFIEYLISKTNMNFTTEKSSNNGIKTLQELATEKLAVTAAEEIQDNGDDGTRADIKLVEESLTEIKDVLALVIILDNTSSQEPSWELIRQMLKDLLPFLESRHGEASQFSITYEIRIIYANDYDDTHLAEKARAKRLGKEYIADPYTPTYSQELRYHQNFVSKAVVGELCRISSTSTPEEKQEFVKILESMKCYGGGDLAEAYAPALKLGQDHTNELSAKYGSKAVIATLFCGDDSPHGCHTSQKGFHRRESWPDGDPSGMDWFQVVDNYTVPIHSLSPAHADSDSRCVLGYATSKTGGFHLNVDANSSQVILRLLMAEMKLSWLLERNLKDMEGASAEEIAKKVAELINKESFEKPANTVPEDPRISEINKEIAKNGIKPELMRCVSDRLGAMQPIPSSSRMKTTSCVTRGVSNAGLMRALRTSTGMTMPSTLMREVSQSVLVGDTDVPDEDVDIEIPVLTRQTAW